MATKEFEITQNLTGKDTSHHFREFHSKTVSELSGKKEALNQAHAKAQTLYSALQNPTKVYAPEVEDILIVAKRELDLLDNDIEDKQRAFEAFRCRHGRVTLPQTVSSIETLLVCAGMVVVEAAVNASFLLNAHMSAGALSALITSTLISGTNVLVSTSAGYFFGRKKNWGISAENPDEKEFKTIRSRAKWLNRLYVAAAGGFLITVGLIRSQEETRRISHSFEHYLELLRTPESVFLVLTGVCMSVLSYHKGRTGFSDPYPQYGEMHQAIIEARADYADCLEDYAEAINDRFDDTVENVSKTFTSIAAGLTAYNQAVSECVTADKGLREAISKAENLLKAEASRISNQSDGNTRRKKSKPNILAMEALCDLSSDLPGDLPNYFEIPDSAPLLFEMEAARHRALAQLASLSTIPPSNEE